MLNSTTNNQSTKINTPATGIIQKSSDNSFFLKLHQNSELAEDIFKPKGKYKGDKISVIQVMLINDNWLLVECIYVE